MNTSFRYAKCGCSEEKVCGMAQICGTILCGSLPRMNTMPIVKERKKPQQSRLNVRVSPEIKARIARAADILDQDLTEFAVSTLNERAVNVIDKHDHIVLSAEEYRFFLDALDEPAKEPSEYSRRALAEYRRGARNGVKYEFED